MSSSVENSPDSQSLLSGQNIAYIGITWGVLSLLFFLLFSINPSGEDSPFWYLMGTYVLELVPFFVATVLCYRNWRSPHIASGRNVWLGLGLGMFVYFIAGLLFGWWEMYLSLDPDVSPADLFYMVFYVFLGWAMVLAVLPRRLNLEVWQWVTVAAIATVGITFAVWILFAAPVASEEAQAPSPTIEQATSAPALAGTESPFTEQTVPETEESLERQPPLGRSPLMKSSCLYPDP